MTDEILPIDKVLNFDENEQTKVAQFIAKQLNIEYYSDCSIDVFMCALKEHEVKAILAKMNA